MSKAFHQLRTQPWPVKAKLTVALLSIISIVSSFVAFYDVRAGSLAPSASPGATMYTLSDIYTRLTTNATATEGSHSFAPAGTPGPTHHTLKQVYEAIPTIVTSTVASSTTYLGIKGTLLGNMFNGTCSNDTYCPNRTEFPGGSQDKGGVDDYNNASGVPPNAYKMSWTQCNSSAYDPVTNPGGNYCNTGAAGADMKDNSTGLVWSLPCKKTSTDCDTFTESSPSQYTWDSSGANNNGKTASQLCSAGSHGQSGWFLPHQKQLMQAYIDGSYGNLEPSAVNRFYWSGTTRSYGTTAAWFVFLSYGVVVDDVKTNPYYVRCVRPL